MLRSGALLTLLLCKGALAHVKPFEHTHIGFLHPEELTAVAVLLSALGAFLGYRAVRRRV